MYCINFHQYGKAKVTLSIINNIIWGNFLPAEATGKIGENLSWPKIPTVRYYSHSYNQETATCVSYTNAT